MTGGLGYSGSVCTQHLGSMWGFQTRYLKSRFFGDPGLLHMGSRRRDPVNTSYMHQYLKINFKIQNDQLLEVA